MKIKILLSIAFLNFNFLYSQSSGIISGYVFEEKTLCPIENAEIIITETNTGTITDNKGYFKFSGLALIKYELTIKHIGYESRVKKINLTTQPFKELEIFLIPVPQHLSEIIIEGSEDRDHTISRLPYIETIMFKKQIDETSVRDVGDYLRTANNVGGIRKGGTGIDPVIRGLKFSQLNVQVNNGHKIEGGCPNRMDPATAHVETEDIEAIEIYKGPYALKYGPSFGGVINMITIMPDHCDSSFIRLKASTGYESNWNGNKGFIGVNGVYKFLFFNVSGGRKIYGNYKDGEGLEVKSGFNKYNYRGQLGFIPKKNHQLLVSYDRSYGRDIFFPSLPMDERSDDTKLIAADYKGIFTSGILRSVKIKIYNSDVVHEMDNKNRPYSDTVIAISKIHAVNRGSRTEGQFLIWNGLLAAGVDLEFIEKEGERNKNMILQPGLPVKIEKLWNRAEIQNTGIFAEYSKKFGTTEALASIRIDFNTASSDSILIMHPMQGEIFKYDTDSIRSNFTNLSFSLGVTKKINNNFAISLSAGRGTRSPDMTERFIILLPIGNDNFDYLGNPLLKPETNNQFDLTFKFNNDIIGSMQLNGFYSLLHNYIAGKPIPPSEQKPLTVGVDGVKQFNNLGNARLMGFEFSYSSPEKYKPGIIIFGSYTYGTLDETELFIKSASGEITGKEVINDDPIAEIPPFEFSSIFSYKFLKNRFIPKLTLRFVGEKSKVSESQDEDKSPGFITAGLAMYYSFNRYLNMSGGVSNIFDRSYYEHLNRNIVGSNRNLYEPGRVFYINLMFNI